MQLTGLHFLLTYQCNLECDHCFVFGGQWQTGTLTIEQIRDILQQGKALGTVTSVYFEGGEPFLYYATLLKAMQMAHEMGYEVGIVSNGYWAISEEDAFNCLAPLRGMVSDLTVSSDIYHWSEQYAQFIENIRRVAPELDMPVGVISVAQPEDVNAAQAIGTLPPGESRVMCRGRAAVVLSERAAKVPWESLDHCPYEDLIEPGRVHVDAFGHLHICQGISIGSLFEQPLSEIVADYDHTQNSITAPLLAGGPAELVRRYDLPHEAEYADACHLCFSARQTLRENGQFTDILTPDQMYGVTSA